ncbi:MAG: surface protein [Flavipsychrobacter sp.]|nr:surface protein [Flavipsychrobacter sp.]
MKKTFILLPLAALLVYALSSNSAGPGAAGNGDHSGATSSATGCGGIGGCHSTSSSSGTLTMSMTLYDAAGITPITPVQYTPGTSYKIMVMATNGTGFSLPKFGFQVSTVKTSSPSTNAGTLAAITGAHMGTYTGISIIEHSSAMTPTSGSGGPGTTYMVMIPWTAPVAGTGSVTSFAVINAVNADGGATTADKWSNLSMAIAEGTSSGVPPITGILNVCKAATTALTDATSGGTWSSGNTAVATVNTSGVVTGVAAGTANITYDLGTPGKATATVTVSIMPAPAAITGANLVCVGTHIIMSDVTAGGAWSSTATANATVTSTGVVSGVAVGTATISYTVTNACGTTAVTKSVTVKALGSGCVSAVAPVGTISGTELKVYPNPNTGMFTVNLQSEDNAAAHVVITNIVGATVSEFTTTTNKTVDVTIDRPIGIYFLTARTVSGIYTTKIMVQ